MHEHVCVCVCVINIYVYIRKQLYIFIYAWLCVCVCVRIEKNSIFILNPITGWQTDAQTHRRRAGRQRGAGPGGGGGGGGGSGLTHGAARRRWFTQWISGNPSSLQPAGSPRGGSNHLVTPRSWDALENETTRKNCKLGASGAQRCPAFMRKK